jgi:hypothetical protein
VTSFGVQFNSGGKGSGTKARYPPGHRTFFPGTLSVFPAIRFIPRIPGRKYHWTLFSLLSHFDNSSASAVQQQKCCYRIEQRKE